MGLGLVARSAGLLAALAWVGAACSMGGTTSLAPRASDRIDSEEVRASTAANAFELVRRLRPNWIAGRGSESIRNRGEVYPVVYVGPTRQGPVEILRSFALGGIEELRFVDATTATTRYGSGHAGGVILVVLRARQEAEEK